MNIKPGDIITFVRGSKYLVLEPGAEYNNRYISVHIISVSTGKAYGVPIYPGELSEHRKATKEELLLVCSRCKVESIREHIKKWLKERL